MVHIELSKCGRIENASRPGRRLLRSTPKSIAGRYYQLLSGHAAIGSCLKDKIRKTEDDRCWWCGGGERQTRHHLFTECRAWMPQIRRLWKDIGKAHGWKHPRAPSDKYSIYSRGTSQRCNDLYSGKWLWKEKFTEAVLAFLGSTKIGCISARRTPPEEVDGADMGDEGEEGGPGPPVG